MNFKSFDPDKCYSIVTEDLWQYVYARDSGLCQVYGGAGEEVHHVKYKSDSVENKANNLILLSNKAHYEEHNVSPRDVKVYKRRIKANEKRFRSGLV